MKITKSLAKETIKGKNYDINYVNFEFDNESERANFDEEKVSQSFKELVNNDKVTVIGILHPEFDMKCQQILHNLGFFENLEISGWTYYFKQNI
ncbi:MAG: hypothetical protein E7273_10600 [Pseudobutyrivibrio ruminis]|nr:hypothetical protein [Pseudobutyrivibrio ruminis]